MPFKFGTEVIQGLVVVETVVLEDSRGFFLETYKASDFALGGVSPRFVQDNHSLSRKGVVRGLHFQRDPHAQAKLVRVCRGSVWDVAVDLRPGSPTYGEWFGIELSEANRRQLFIPEGFAHGFQALSEEAELLYKCSAEYDPSCDSGIRWDDPTLAIRWPISDAVVSPKDAALPPFGEHGAPR